MPTFVDRGVSRGQRGESTTVVNVSFLDRGLHDKENLNVLILPGLEVGPLCGAARSRSVYPLGSPGSK
jgi:hypothetical protein